MNRIPALGIDLGHANVKVCSSIHGSETHLEAFPAHHPVLRSGGVRELGDGPRADGVVVRCDGNTYFVGPDSQNFLQGTAPKPAQLGYSQSIGYKALMLGALSRAIARVGISDGSQVELVCLGLGLPLTTYFSEREPLRRGWVGKFEVPLTAGTATLIVRDAVVLAQPVGALIAHAVRLGERAIQELAEVNSLVLDAGGGTLDYLTTTGGVRINGERSGASASGMDACTHAVAQRFGGDEAEDWLANPHTLRIIGRAVARRGEIRLGARTISEKEYLPVVEGIVRTGVDAALQRLGSTSDIGLVLVVGGGGSLVAKELASRVPRLAPLVKVEENPLYTNVRGFYFQAQRKAQSLMRSMGVSEGVAA